MEAKTENVTQKVSRKQGNRGYIGPQYRHIGQQQEPGGQKSIIIPADFTRVGINAAGIRVLSDHVLQVVCDNQNDGHTKQQPDCCSHNPGLCQIGVAGDNKGAPANAGPNGKCPDA